MKKTINILKTFLTWRLLLFVAVLFFVPLDKSFVSFTNFDGIRYLNIAKEGYGTPHTFYSYSLFPLYPLMIRSLAPIFGYLSSSLLISHFFALASLILFKRLAELDYSKEVAHRAMLLLLCFPASFFLISAYSESLFLFLTLLAIYFSRKGLLVPSALVAFLASYTRAAGLFLWIVLVIEYIVQNKNQIKSLLSPRALYLLVPPLGALYYLNYIQINTSNFMRFLPSIPSKFVFLHQVILRYFKMVTFVDHSSSLFWIVLTESLVGFLALYLLVVSFKHLRLSYWVYFFLSFFIPSLWGNFVGLPRFLLVTFPFFYALAYIQEKQHPYFQKLYFIVSLVLLCISLGLFVNGVFVG